MRPDERRATGSFSPPRVQLRFPAITHSSQSHSVREHGLLVEFGTTPIVEGDRIFVSPRPTREEREAGA